MRSLIVVLGDSDRRPRARLHALALAALGEVDVVGLDGGGAHTSTPAESGVRVHHIGGSTPGRTGTGRLAAFSAWFADRWLACRLALRLSRLQRPDVVLIQVPPARPTLAVSILIGRLRGSRVVVDWRNLAHTELAVGLGDGHRAVHALRRVERRWARRADAHLAASNALGAWLTREYGIKATVVHSRAPVPSPPAEAERRNARAALGQVLGTDLHDTPLVIAPTSWSPEDDFDLLIEALERAERTLAAAPAQAPTLDAKSPPALVVVLTGRGEGRAGFEQRIARRRFDRIAVRTAWLEGENYHRALGAADVGLCLRQSSSGLDLPSAVPEFRAAGVPVAAFDYAPVLSEIVTPGEQGVLIRDAGALATLLVATAGREEGGPVAASRRWLAEHPVDEWREYWNGAARATVVGS
jgi:beta-1,4-mannosyltransferase